MGIKPEVVYVGTKPEAVIIRTTGLFSESRLTRPIKSVEEVQTLIDRGCQIWGRSGSDWHQIGQIRDFLRSDF